MVSIKKVYAVSSCVYICLYFLIWYRLKKVVHNDAGGEIYWRLIIRRQRTLFSSNINEGKKAVLFFLRKDFTRTKSIKTHISEQKQKKQRFYALKKPSKGKIVAYSLICVFMLFCAFCAF